MLQRFHPDIPRVCRDLSCHRQAHGTDHDRFVFYMHVLGFCISFPPVPPEQGISDTMCTALHAWQTAAIHEWMDADHSSLRDAHAAGWPLAPWQWHLEGLSPWHGVPIPLLPIFPRIRLVRRHLGFVTDSSCFLLHRCGGLFAVVCLETLTWVVYPMPIPCQLDHSYAVEVYTSWVLYRVKSMVLEWARVSCATAHSLRERGNFTSCKLFIMALHCRWPDDLGTRLMDLLLADSVRR